MKKFIGEILVLIGSIGIIVCSLVSGGTMIYGLVIREFNVLTSTSFLFGWIALFLTVFTRIYGFMYSMYALRMISLGRNSKKSFYLSLIFLVFEVARVIYISLKIDNYYSIEIFYGLIIATFTLFIVQAIGMLLNYKNK